MSNRNQEESLLGKVFCVCFMLIWISIPGFGAISAYSGGAPIEFVIIPLGMAALGVIILIALLTGKVPTPGSLEGAMPSGTTTSQWTTTPSRESVVYTPPTTCPNCGAPLSVEQVEWVGPLQIMCPSCGHTVDAVKKIL